MRAPVQAIRWRDKDPGEGVSQWTKVHALLGAFGVRTVCGLQAPEHPYEEEVDGEIPRDAPICKRCGPRVGIKE